MSRKLIATNVAACRHRAVPAGLAGVALAQSETVRGEPRVYYVLCLHSTGRFEHCACAQGDLDCPSQRTADNRAQTVTEERRKYSRC